MIKNIKTYFLLIFFCFCFTNAVKSQDIIYKKDYTDTIYCHIVKDNIKNVEYRLISSYDTSIHVISFNEIEGYILSSKKVNNTIISKPKKSDLSSNDIIYLKDYSDTIICHIVKDNIKNIEYRLVSSNDTSLHVISSNDIDGYVLAQNNINTVKKDTNTLTARDSVFLKTNEYNNKKANNSSRIYIIIISTVLAVIASSLSMMPK